MAYLFLYLIISIFVFIELGEKGNRKLLFAISAMTIFLLTYFAGFRDNVGADDHAYIAVFKEIKNVFHEDFAQSYINYYMEPGFIFLTSFVKLITDDYHFLFLITSFLAIGINLYHYYKYSPFVMLTIGLYFSHTFLARDMNQIRAGLAAAILLFSIKYIREKNFYKFLFIIILASSFHIAAAVFFITYFIARDYHKTTTYIYLLLIAIVLSYLELSKFLVENLPDFLGIIKTVLINYYNSVENKNATSTFDITNIKQLFIAISLILCFKRLQKTSSYFVIMFNIYFIGVFWRIIFSDFGIFAARFATFFTIVEVILVPFLLLCFFPRQRIIVAIIILCYGFATLYLNIFQKKIKPVHSYKSYIIKENN